MPHADDEVLAALALHDTVPDDVRDHVAHCPTCRRRVDDLADFADLTRDARHEQLTEPPDAVWLAVAAQLSSPDGDSPADPSRRTRLVARPRWRTTSWLVAAAVVLALGAGAVGGWVLARRGGDTPTDVVAATALRSLTGNQDLGTARVVWTPGHTTLQVSATSLPPSDGGLHEVWLLNQDGRRMVALGLLPSADRGSFAMPQRLIDEGYRIVDISVEPDDGDPTHSGDSVARGTLTEG